MHDPDCIAAAREYYTGKLRTFGPTARGADWNSEDSQFLRFDQLLRIAEGAEDFSLIDYGCGYGALVSYLRSKGRKCEYFGFDVSPAMTAAARDLYGGCRHCTFADQLSQVPVADYAVASGVLNVKLQFQESEWEPYVLATLHEFDRLSRKGFAFNLLSRYADAERMRPDLYYADPLFLFDYCKKQFSPFVALLHDYPLYEFTILVRK